MTSIKDQIEYWRESAGEDMKTARVLFDGKRYSGALFFGHIVLEKILKAFVVLETEKEAPKIHNLIRLHELGNVGLDESTLKYIATVNAFNIRGRYEDYKKSFYQMCTKEYTVQNLNKIGEIYKMLCKKLEQGKL
jgi:HEPN domain-containing protein